MSFTLSTTSTRKVDTRRAFGEALQSLPIELLLEVVGHLDCDAEEPRSWQTTVVLQALMNASRRFRSTFRPLFWSEVQLSSKRSVGGPVSSFRSSRVCKARWQDLRTYLSRRRNLNPLALFPREKWSGLQTLLQSDGCNQESGNLDANLISCLSLRLTNLEGEYAGIQPANIAEMARMLPRVTNIKLTTDSRVRLYDQFNRPGNLGEIYIHSLRGFADRLTHLAVRHATVEQAFFSIYVMSWCKHLTHLLLDNVLDSHALHFRSDVLPALESFRLRNAPSVIGNGLLSRVMSRARLCTLQLRDVGWEEMAIFILLATSQETLKQLDFGSTSTPGVIDPTLLQPGYRRREIMSSLSLATTYYHPLSILRQPITVGNEVASRASNLTKLSLGGMFCVTPALFKVLIARERPLDTLTLYNAWPIRLSRPDDHPDAAEEKELLLRYPIGIAPEDVLEALKAGLNLRRLEMLDMGDEWDLEVSQSAKQVAQECERRGIALVSTESDE